MKIYKNTLGVEIAKTMTVGELREKLSEYPVNMPVFGGWEGVKGCVTPEDFYVEEFTKHLASDKKECLIIDVENL